MSKGLPGWFRTILVLVLLALCVTVATQLFRQISLEAQLSELEEQLTASQKRTEKLIYEREQHEAELPLLQAQLEALTPDYEAVYAREQELRAQRKALRAELAQAQEDESALEDASDTLQQALEILRGN